MRKQSWTVVVLLIGFAVVSGLAQQAAPPASTGVIAGTLTVAGAGDPVRKATVRIVSAATRMARTTTTDQDGRFVFELVPAGEYTLSGSKLAFMEMVYGARRPGPGVPGATLKLAAGQKLQGLSFSLLRGGVIAGTVVDEFGDPSYSTSVRALRFSFAGGQRTLTPAGTGTTDDRGQYRIPGLLPGEYLVTAVPRDTVAVAAGVADSQRARLAEIAASLRATDPARAADMDRMARETPASPPTFGYVPVYYPGTPHPSTAATVRLGTSDEVGGIDMRLQVLRTGTVTGTVSSTDPTSEVNVQLIDPAMPVASVGVWFRTVKDGKFTFYGVVPGTYMLHANASAPRTAPGGAGELTAEREIAVSVDPAPDYALRLERGVLVTGTLALDTLRGAADASKLRVEFYPVMTSAQWEMPVWREAPDATGAFVAKGVVPGRFRVRVSGLPPGWFLASAVFAGKDAADYHLTVESGGSYAGVFRFTDRVAEITGTLTNTMGAPAPEHTVIVFPDDRELWLPDSRRIHVMQAAADGRYIARGLPPGDYRIATMLDPETGAWFDREWLARLVPLAVPVTLAEGERKVQDLRVR